MSTSSIQPRVYDTASPDVQTIPLVLASPHSGRDYPAEFLETSRVDENALAHSEDRYVDQLVADAPSLGAPLIRALFPRTFIDLNREAFELDPTMFDEPLPAFVNSRSPRVAAGLGTIARVIGGGREIYDHPLRFSDALRRISGYYQPYHTALRRLIDDTVTRFGICLLVDCHSMPSDNPVARERAPDFVLGDCHAASCRADIVTAAEGLLSSRGFAVARNRPYAGGFTTRHYGRPAKGVHALQVEINRALYMDENSLTRGDGFARVASAMNDLVGMLGRHLLDGDARGRDATRDPGSSTPPL